MEPNATPPNMNQPQPQKPNPVIIKRNNNAPLVGAILFLAVVIAATAYYVGTENETNQTSNAPTPIPTQTPQSPTPQVTNGIQWETITSKKMPDLAFSEFSISYPPDWEQKETQDTLTKTFTLTKDGNEIKIHQGPMGGNQCVFEGEVPDGPANDYTDTEFVEIKAGDITLRRIVTENVETPTIYSFCSNTPQSLDTFGIPTIFGVITYTLESVDETTLQEMDEILATLKQTP